MPGTIAALEKVNPVVTVAFGNSCPVGIEVALGFISPAIEAMDFVVALAVGRDATGGNIVGRDIVLH